MLTTRNYGILVCSDLSAPTKSVTSFQKLLKDLLSTGLKLLCIRVE